MSNTTFVTKATSYVRSLGRKRSNRTVTADDVQNYLNRAGFSGDQNERLSVIRSVLNNSAFAPNGYARSARPEARSRTIRAYRVTA